MFAFLCVVSCLALAIIVSAYDPAGTYSVSVPSPAGAYEARLSDGGGWFVIPSNTGGWSLLEDAKIGLRTQAEGDPSAVVYKFETAHTPAHVDFIGDGLDTSISFSHDIGTTYSTDVKSTRRDVWDSTSFNPVTWSGSVEAYNGCATMNVQINTTDASGAKQSKTMSLEPDDTFSLSVPTNYPVFATVTAVGKDAQLNFNLTGDEKVSAAFGTGNVPTVSASFVARGEFCGD